MLSLRRSRTADLAFGALVTVVYLYLIMMVERTLLRGWLVDDAYISLRHAKNFVEGNGLVYNAGERVEAYTNFSLTMLSAIPYALGLEPSAFVKALCVVAGLSVVFSAGELARLVAGRGGAVVTMIAIAADRRFAFFSAWGLETTMVAAFYVPAMVLAAKRRYVASAIFFFLAVTTRMESVLLLGATATFVALRAIAEREPSDDLRAMARPVVRLAGTFAVPYLVYFVWRFAYYGWLFPNTYYAKVGRVSMMWPRGVKYLDDCFRGMHFGTSIAVSVGALALAGGLSIATRRSARAAATAEANGLGLLVVGATALHLLYVISVGGDHFGERFVYHVFPLIVVSVTFAWSSLARVFVRHEPLGGTLGAIASAAAILPLTLSPMFFATSDTLAGWAAAGIYLREHADPKAWLATDAAGIMPLESNLRTIDVLGLADTHIAHLPVEVGQGTAGHEKQDPAYVIDRKPDYVSTWIDRDGHVGRGFRKYWVFWRDWQLGYRVRTDTAGTSQTRIAPVTDALPLELLAKDAEALYGPGESYAWGIWVYRPGASRARPFGRMDLGSQVPHATENVDVLVRAKRGHAPGYVMLGPGMIFPPGSYRVSFDVKTTSAGIDVPAIARICNFDVFDGHSVVYERELVARDWIDRTGAVGTTFPVRSPAPVEFRLHCDGSVDVEVLRGSVSESR